MARASDGALAHAPTIAAEAGGPLLFGVLADRFAGGGDGLRWRFLLTLVTLLAAAALLQVARRFYPNELATAHESLRRA